ncbi:hypothetical protein KIH31_02625 [Paenarthrobacter sp. DKR-5]|uniref:hypothetical protein n=1 Tax=Paenarthrobacter sp. DKR-5 TaxID=2835535 RepID=UPI001BDD8DF8|nr:hypothetical protein [Paenarthrobacter sp. DKR-5]MBT1001486.1 hypothetical protein [Paenarthrobacter sp. DKR-5]
MRYRQTDEFTVTAARASAVETLSRRLQTSGYRVEETEWGLAARTGSDLIFRIMGLFSPNTVPVGLEVVLEDAGSGTRIQCTAFDRMGWYINAKPALGADRVLDCKLSAALSEVRDAFGNTH